jgi:antitoxin component of MazEF toxin-antitoxin module
MKRKIQETRSTGGLGLPNLTKIFEVLGWKKGEEVEITLGENREIIIKKVD